MNEGEDMAARVMTAGEKILKLVEELRELRQEVEIRAAVQARTEHLLEVFGRFMGLAEGRHLNRDLTAEPYPPGMAKGLVDLSQLEEIAKAMDVADSLKEPEGPDPMSGMGAGAFATGSPRRG